MSVGIGLDEQEQELIRASVRALLAGTGAAEVPSRLAEEGWTDLLAVEPLAATRLLFADQGQSCSASPALDLIAQLGCGLDVDPTRAILYPAIGSTGEPTSRLERGQVVLRGVVLGGWERASDVLVPCRTPDGVVLVTVARSLFDPRPLRGADPRLGLAAVEAAVSTVSDVQSGRPGAGWDAGLTFARLALATELTGLASAMLGRALDHVMHRRQFGRPIAANQSVKHRLADVAAAVAASEAVLDVMPCEPSELHGMAGKALAFRAADAAARGALQVCGAMGFTAESGLHNYVRRAHLLDALLGSAAQLEGLVGRRLRDNGGLPPVIEL